LSEGTLAQARATCAAQLEPVETAIKHALGQAPVVHCDPHLTVGTRFVKTQIRR
jgi:hypothetical protein